MFFTIHTNTEKITMTKGEAIKYAWRDLFDKLSIRAKECILNNNGQISLYVLDKYDKHILLSGKKDIRNRYESDFECTKTDEGTEFMFRPKSLQGIENNNGWIKIESEEDLPKEGMTNYLYCVDGKPSIHVMNLTQIISCYKDGMITHYQPIEKQKPPIY